MATDGTVLRFRALHAPSAALWLLAVGVLCHLTGPSVASPTKAGKAGADASSYRSYHFVLLVKSNGPSKANVTAGDVSEELVVMPADAGLLERSGGSAIELKPQPLPRHITSALVKRLHSTGRLARRQNPSTPVPAAGSTSKKQRYPKKATPAPAGKTKPLKDKVTIHRLGPAKLAANRRQLSLADADLRAPFELVATSKRLPGQSRTVRKTGHRTASDKQQQTPRYEVIGTFRDAHVSRARTTTTVA